MDFIQINEKTYINKNKIKKIKLDSLLNDNNEILFFWIFYMSFNSKDYNEKSIQFISKDEAFYWLNRLFERMNNDFNVKDFIISNDGKEKKTDRSFETYTKLLNKNKTGV
jgi:hypothetical protein